MREKFIRIQSTQDITVTAGLQCLDVTNPDAHVPDRLKIQSLWPKTTCDIHKGVGIYPIEIIEWNTVKCLVKDGILTLGERVNEVTTEEADVIEKKEKLNAELNEVAKVLDGMNKRERKESLADIAGDE